MLFSICPAGDPLELMVQFFVKFGDKPCCITDLKIFLDLLQPDEHVQVRLYQANWLRVATAREAAVRSYHDIWVTIR